MATASPGASRGPGAPVRRTVLGLERQGLGWTLAIGAIALVLAVGLPLADSAVSTEPIIETMSSATTWKAASGLSPITTARTPLVAKTAK